MERPVTGVAFLHAFPCDHRMWAPAHQAVVVAGWSAQSLDLPGFGTRPLLAEEPSLDAVADDVVQQLGAAQDDAWIIVGVSLGGYVAMNLLRRHVDLITGVVLCDTKATADTAAARENRHRLAELIDASPRECSRILEQAVLPGLLGPTTREQRPQVVAQVVEWLHDANPAAVAWYQRAMAERPDSRSVLAHYSGSAALIWGEEDALSPLSEQQVMLDALPQARLVTIPGAGHLANVECADEVAAALLEFLSPLAADR